MQNKKILMILLISFFVILLSGVFYYVSLNNNFFVKSEPKGIKVIGDNMYNAEIKDMVLNVGNKNGKNRIMKLSLTLKSSNPEINTIITKYTAEILDVFIMMSSSYKSEDLMVKKGKERFKKEALIRINKVYNQIKVIEEEIKMEENEIKKILFLEFLIA